MSARKLVHLALLGAALASSIAAAAPAPASAGILSKGTPEQKQRRDIAKQIAKYWFCVYKATAKCERDGGHSGVECFPPNGTAVPPADPRGKFGAALEKCDEKLDFNKQGSGNPIADYVAMSCPTLENPPAASVDAMQDATIRVVRSDVLQKLQFIDFFCPQGEQSTDPAALECTATHFDVLLRYWKAILKCQEKCENDYSGKNGNGGRNNTDACSFTVPDQSYLDCRAKAIDVSSKSAGTVDPSFFGYPDGSLRYFDFFLYNASCP